MDGVALLLKVEDDFLRTRGVAGALPIYAIEDRCHCSAVWMHRDYVLTADDKPVADLFRDCGLGRFPQPATDVSKCPCRISTRRVMLSDFLLTMGGTMEYFRDTAFNYPTLAEAYKVAALDGLNKL